MCPWFEAVVTPPKGWTASKNETHINRVALMFPGAKVDYSGAVMYVKTTFDGDNQPLAGFIAAAQSRWKASHADFTAEKLADFKRAGKPDCTVYLYKNPSMPQQAFELTAFVKDADPAQKDQNCFSGCPDGALDEGHRRQQGGVLRDAGRFVTLAEGGRMWFMLNALVDIIIVVQ
jgi:hypothetical protein